MTHPGKTARLGPFEIRKSPVFGVVIRCAFCKGTGRIRVFSTMNITTIHAPQFKRKPDTYSWMDCLHCDGVGFLS